MGGRGQSPLAHPAEWLYTADNIGATGVNCVFDNNTAVLSERHFFSQDEIVNGTVSISCSIPTGLGMGGIMTFKKIVHRARSVASIAIENARIGYGAVNLIAASAMVAKNCVPAVGSIINKQQQTPTTVSSDVPETSPPLDVTVGG